ncbi:MAG: phage holin family protein [Bacillota bacterium]|nr:phage holin family protein [Bacillota bacterium]
MKRPGLQTHLLAACLFSLLAALAFWMDRSSQNDWRLFGILTGAVAAIAWILFLRSRLRARKNPEDACDLDNMPDFPEGQAKLIDSGKLPNRYHPRVDMREFEVCHFYVPSKRLLFAPLPEGLKIDPTRLAVRYSGGQYYYIVRPQEILLPAQADDQIDGELVITSQRILFLADENGFEVPLQSLKLLDCSAHLVDFQVRNRRYTVQTEAACYAEKVLMLLLQPKT